MLYSLLLYSDPSNALPTDRLDALLFQVIDSTRCQVMQHVELFFICTTNRIIQSTEHTRRLPLENTLIHRHQQPRLRRRPIPLRPPRPRQTRRSFSSSNLAMGPG